MTSPTPDIAQLSLSASAKNRDYDAFNDHGKTFPYNTSPPIHSHMPPQFYQASLAQQSAKKPARAGLPSHWLDQGNDPRALSPPHTSDVSSGGSPPMGYLQQPAQPGYTNTTPPSINQPALNNSLNGINDDDVIPTAIVIKNIPFNVKRETLLDIISSLAIPTPYAFNYHIDTQGVFRGLAFANFRVPADADAVVAALNGFDVQGRKLRVEYKKVLQAGEKERIEREKAIKRMKSMQLEKERQAIVSQQAVSAATAAEQQAQWDAFGPVHASSPSGLSPPNGGLAGVMGGNILGGGGMSPPPGMMGGMPVSSPARSYSGVGLGMPSAQQDLGIPPVPVLQQPQPPQQYPSPPPTTTPSTKSASTELDLNDPSTLEIYSRILVFKEDRMRDELAFSRSLSPRQRRVVHLVAQRLGVYHYSVGEGEDRYAVVTRIERDNAPRGPVRHASQTLSRASSAYLSPNSQHPQSHSGSAGAPALRVKKSMPDLASLHAPPSRLHTRSSNGNIREGYATITTSTSPRRNRADNFSSLFANGGSSIPPVPSLPSLLNGESSSVLRQPRGPGSGGFGARRPTAGDIRTGANVPSGGLDTRSHEPLEL